MGFSIKRGLRQDCPLSPLLFNVVGEAISGMLKKATVIRLCGNVGVGFGNTDISHIQFADNLLIFSVANDQSLKNFNRVLKIFELAAGLKLNISKSKIFGINVDNSRIRNWANSINYGWAFLPSTYLGLPLGHKKNLKSLWKQVLEKNIVNPIASQDGNMNADFSCIMGNGVKINFWNDNWSEMNSLKTSFPIIFGLALKMSGNIFEFGIWVTDVWVWKIELRRGLFEWEKALWLNFMEVLNKVVSTVPTINKLNWAGSVDGCYSPKSFFHRASSIGKLEDPIWRDVWCKFVPPKASGFVWKIVHQRLSVISELVKQGVPVSDHSFCSFCHCFPESINHILVQCEAVWHIRQRWCSLWHICMVFPSNVKDLLQGSVDGTVMVAWEWRWQRDGGSNQFNSRGIGCPRY
ncbi:uncharacterized protein LOC120188950 [Hibiscus syriacus]|uniref:uncharacterized protein LOC120188950 n=1 Tax=Hibiscus syriacus TaxID=106335 RepID=UPI001923CEE8|nr:uncharacterized protein LOC120188950 [Hibiscus syriacus]